MSRWINKNWHALPIVCFAIMYVCVHGVMCAYNIYPYFNFLFEGAYACNPCIALFVTLYVVRTYALAHLFKFVGILHVATSCIFIWLEYFSCGDNIEQLACFRMN